MNFEVDWSTHQTNPAGRRIRHGERSRPRCLATPALPPPAPRPLTPPPAPAESQKDRMHLRCSDGCAIYYHYPCWRKAPIEVGGVEMVGKDYVGKLREVSQPAWLFVCLSQGRGHVVPRTAGASHPIPGLRRLHAGKTHAGQSPHHHTHTRTHTRTGRLPLCPPPPPPLLQGHDVECPTPGCSGVLTYAEGSGKYVYIRDRSKDLKVGRGYFKGTARVL